MKLSILNLAPVREGQTYLQAVESMVSLAKHAENIGIERYWIAEHHNMKNLVSSATALLIQHTLANTKTLRVGSGGVMLPNHSPYVVAEQYGTLETLYPNRVELGLGRAPGTDMQTAAALRRGRNSLDFPAEIAELRGYFKDCNPVSAYPSAGLNIPFYIFGIQHRKCLSCSRTWLTLCLCFSLCATHDGNGSGDLPQKLQTIDLSC